MTTGYGLVGSRHWDRISAKLRQRLIIIQTSDFRKIITGLRVSVLRSIASEKEPAMAKGQKKSNREVRKPKAEKPKPAPAGQSFLNPFPKKK